MSALLIASKSEVEGHFRSIGEVICEHVDATAQVQIIADWNIAPLVMGVAGSGCETAQRNRGLDAPVAPIFLLKDGLWAWLGYREEWDSEPPAGRTQRFSFRSAGLSIHLGYRGFRYKPQMFRAEWAGWARWNNLQGESYQAGNAAHPHWQFDALESLKPDEREVLAATILDVLRSEADGVPAREFVPSGLTREDASELIGRHDISRIHFASAAVWWNDRPHDAHAHAPRAVRDVQKWLRQTLTYVNAELMRI